LSLNLVPKWLNHASTVILVIILFLYSQAHANEDKFVSVYKFKSQYWTQYQQEFYTASFSGTKNIYETPQSSRVSKAIVMTISGLVGATLGAMAAAYITEKNANCPAAEHEGCMQVGLAVLLIGIPVGIQAGVTTGSLLSKNIDLRFLERNLELGLLTADSPNFLSMSFIKRFEKIFLYSSIGVPSALSLGVGYNPEGNGHGINYRIGTSPLIGESEGYGTLSVSYNWNMSKYVKLETGIVTSYKFLIDYKEYDYIALPVFSFRYSF